MAEEDEGVQDRTKRYTCFDYRREMMLMGLNKQLMRQDLSTAEKIALERAIGELEKEIGLA